MLRCPSTMTMAQCRRASSQTFQDVLDMFSAHFNQRWGRFVDQLRGLLWRGRVELRVTSEG